MHEGSTAFGHIARGLFAAMMLAAAHPVAAANPVVQPPFDQDYTLVQLGKVPGVHEPYGALNFGLGTANQIIIGGNTGAEIGLLYVADLTRDVTGTISGFAGTASVLSDAYAVAGGVAYGPDDVLFYTRVTNEIGEVRYESITTDKVVSLAPVSPWRPGGLNFVPPGFGAAGQLKLLTFAYGDWWSLDIEPDDMGTYDITGATQGPSLPGYPEGFTYVPAGLPDFPNPSVVVCEYANAYGIGKITAYDVDQNSNPILATRREIVTGLDVPYGIATDPLTGDLLFTSYLSTTFVLRKAPVPTTTTAPPTTTTIPTTTTSTTRPPATTSTTVPTTTTSTMAPPTTSTTLRATTTSTTAPPTTTSTAIPATTTSTTIRPTTTSSSSTTSTTSSTTTTTTVPSECASGPSFPSLACQVEALLDLVRASSALGPLQANFVVRFERAQQTVGDGAEQCAAGRRTTAREALDRLERQMTVIRARTRTNRARKIIPAALAAAIADGTRSIGADAHALRGTLSCP